MTNPLNIPGPGDSHDHEYDKREARDAAVTARAEEIFEYHSERIFYAKGFPDEIGTELDELLWKHAVRQAEKEIPR